VAVRGNQVARVARTNPSRLPYFGNPEQASNKVSDRDIYRVGAGAGVRRPAEPL
jgi:hypothetical protein